MYRKCVTERSASNQRQLENALLELMLRIPYGDISVTQICEEAGISRRIFYHLFGSKQDALYGLIDHKILDMESFPTDHSDQALRFLLYWHAQKKLLDALYQTQMNGLLLERMISSILREDYDVWRWLQAEDPENRQDILVFNISGIMGLIFSWYHSGFRKSSEQMAELMSNLMRNPLAKSVIIPLFLAKCREQGLYFWQLCVQKRRFCTYLSGGKCAILYKEKFNQKGDPYEKYYQYQ